MAPAFLLMLLLVALPWSARAADWGAIEPGATTLDQVRARYGAPARESRGKVEGYDTVQWIYEGAAAPAGLERMTVDFGLLTASGFKPSLVRLLKLEPKPLIFGRNTVIQGWGVPDGVGSQDGLVTFFYREGLLVVFDKEGESAVNMIFSVPQSAGASSTPPKR
jgi:hypothetical protein